jgi:tetratricopeptide (TPR) repeat protein
MYYVRNEDAAKAYPHLARLADNGFASAELYAVLSDVEHARRNESKAREYLEKAVALDPKNVRLLRKQAVAYYEDRNYAKAAPAFEQLVSAEPANPDSLYLLGKSYEQLKLYAPALAVMQRVLQIKPDDFEAYGTIGAIFYAQEDWARAAQALTRYTQLRPRDAAPYFVLATCFDKLGNVKEAVVHYNKFLQLDDGSNDVRSFQARERARTLERRLKR